MTAAELLESVRNWLRKLSARAARFHRLEADDVFQAACLRILAVADQYDPAKGTVSTWATWQHRQAVSRLLYRRGRSVPAVGVGREALEQHHVPEAEEVEPVPYLKHLTGALNLLPPKEREVIEQHHGLHDHEARTLADIGAGLGVRACESNGFIL